MSIVTNLDTTEQTIQDVFSEVTRYPKDILTLDADFEEELGIDSVKLSEIFAVLQQKFPQIHAQDISQKKVTNLRQVVDEVKQFIHTQALVTPPKVSKPSIQTHTAIQKNKSRIFEGKVAFVSGSARGIGKEIALDLLARGATVVVNSFHSRNLGEELVSELQNKGKNIHHIWGSMANSNHIDDVFAQIETKFSKLDFFIHNASNGILANLADIKKEHWQKAYRTNVIGFHQAAIAAKRIMSQSGGGKIIALSSPGTKGYIEYFSCIATVKAAVESLVKSMAAEWKPLNIAVNCLSVGAVYGNLLHKFPESKELIPFWESLTTSGKLCTAQDVANMVALLLRSNSRLLTGSIVNMDGGSSVYTYVNRNK